MIFKNDKNALKEYCNLLFNNSESSNLHSKVNIGFHLDYYGDIINQSPGQCPECEDNPDKGHNTFRKLKLDLSTKIDKNIIDGNLVIQILTFCMMLDRDGKKFNVYEKDRNALLIKFLSLLETNTELKDYINYNVENYFNEALSKLQQEDIIKNQELKCDYKYLDLPNLDRQGWVDRKVKNPESVAEHSYTCWLIGYIYLPLKLDNISDYDKNKILTLLLIHDIGEVEIGDIVTSLKGVHDKISEKQAVERFLSRTAENNEHGKLLEYWEEMSMLGCANGDVAGRKQESINSQIAKEIDYIQRVYQYFKYFVEKNIEMITSADDRRIIENPSHDVVLANISDWLKDISDKNIKTAIGKEIRDKLILLNPNFLENRDLYIAFYSVKANGFK